MSEDIKKTDVLTPSAASVGVCLAGVGLALFFIVLPRLGGDALFGLVFGKDASLSLIQSSKESYGPLIENLLSNDLLGRAVVFGVWAFVGLCAFVLVTSAASLISTVSEQQQEMNYVHQNRSSLLRHDVETVLLRLGIAALWGGFVVIFVRFVLSYFAITGFVALGEGKAADWGIFVVAAAIMFLALHVQIVLARLLVGRTRIWED